MYYPHTPINHLASLPRVIQAITKILSQRKPKINYIRGEIASINVSLPLGEQNELIDRWFLYENRPVSDISLFDVFEAMVEQEDDGQKLHKILSHMREIMPAANEKKKK